MPEFDERRSWQAAIIEPLSNYVPEECWIHTLEKLYIIGISDERFHSPIGPMVT
jgi:hypothetical protein